MGTDSASGVQVLIVEDNSNLAQSAGQLLEMRGAVVDVAGSVAEAEARLRDFVYQLVLVDLMLPDGSGLDLIDAHQGGEGVRFVVMTGHPSLTAAVRERYRTRADFLLKPFSARDLIETYRRVVPNGDGGVPAEAEPFGDWVGSSEVLDKVKHQIRSVAPLDTTVFLLGESGTGKELAARSLHRLSRRCEGPFLTVNCGAMPESLIANELFGHEKGSYTGANKAQAGLFERAAGGTVFLDEVTELPMEHQPHLLRVLETQTVTRIGGTESIPIDARIVAASNRVDQALVQDGVLREDLFYRLMVFPIVLPPLRERRDDVPELVSQVLAAWNREHGTSLRCSQAVMERLKSHHWPGNVRELKHTVQRLAILNDGLIDEPPSFFDSFAGTDEETDSGVPVGTSIRELERRLILATLEHYGGDRGRTAETLGISQKTLYNRLKAYEQAGVWSETAGTAS